MFRLVLVLSRVWPYMTPEYVYNELTWAEVNDALAYVYQYEMDEKRWAAKPYNKNTKLSDWWQRIGQSVEDGLRDLIQTVRGKHGR